MLRNGRDFVGTCSPITFLTDLPQLLGDDFEHRQHLPPADTVPSLVLRTFITQSMAMELWKEEQVAMLALREQILFRSGFGRRKGTFRSRWNPVWE